MQHVGVSSWFHRVCNAQPDFVANKRIVWVDIEGVPLHAWSRKTFTKICSKWGEMLELEKSSDDFFARKRICIKTKLEDNILEKFKIIIRGKIFVIRAKELFVWSPVFNEVKEAALCSDDESLMEKEQPVNVKEYSPGPFGIYGLMGKKMLELIFQRMTREPSKSPNRSVCSRVVMDSHNTDAVLGSDERGSGCSQKKDGSVLVVLDDIIKEDKAMGYSMKGCEKDIEGIIRSHGDGLLCVWDSSVFLKENHIISDNFLVLYGSWKPNKTKLLVISIYAPQSLAEKRLLWNYISLLISRWGGECIVMGDFNEVRCEDERMGSAFNEQGAAVFNDFISDSGLIDIQLGGYSFTWSHPSASKMSKLDRFLLTEGLISLFPQLSAICLNRHLSDHRPILLREVDADYGAIPFRFYHSWFNLNGFEHMVSNTWKSTVLSDRNRMLDNGDVSDDILLSRSNLMKQMQDIKSSDARDSFQKAKIKWAIEGDENSKFFHGIINHKRSTLAIRGIMVDGEWVDDPSRVKDEDSCSFVIEFQSPTSNRSVVWFFNHSSFARGCNSAFIALIPKVPDPNTFKPLSFPNRQILMAFIINELLYWCKCKKKQAMVFKVDFAKAYDSIRWDYLDEVLHAFGFGVKWRAWIRGSLSSGMASILINGSPTSEFEFHCGLKQGDPLAPSHGVGSMSGGLKAGDEVYL
ncbi:RNA-directed DNA polymerase, eukaryota [Tanacetum coccineum]